MLITIFKLKLYISNLFRLCCHNCYTYLLSQILIDCFNSMLLCMELHEKLEPLCHSVIFGSISLLRLKVFSSTLCSFLSICTVFKGWLSRCHFTLSVSGKKPLRVQTSVTAEVLNLPFQTGCNVMFGKMICGSEIEQRLLFLFLHYSTVLDVFQI